MKIAKYLFMSLTLLLFNCSTSDSEVKVEENPILIEKDLLMMTGDSNHWLHYENGKIKKAWSDGTTYRSQMVYNSNGTISREYREGTGNANSDNENFEWEITASNSYIENIYENEKLKSIIRHDSGNSWKLVEYTYQGDLVIEKRDYFGEDNSVYRYYRYEYNDLNELITIIWDESPSGGSSHTLEVTFDDKINPYYKIWKETKLTFWDAQDGPARFNLEFYPNNVLNLQEGTDDIWYNALYTYDEDDFPITRHINEGVEAGDDNKFEYQ